MELAAFGHIQTKPFVVSGRAAFYLGGAESQFDTSQKRLKNWVIN